MPKSTVVRQASLGVRAPLAHNSMAARGGDDESGSSQFPPVTAIGSDVREPDAPGAELPATSGEGDQTALPVINNEDAGKNFAEIAEQHKSFLWKYAYRLSGKSDVADDLVQDTLERGLQSFDSFQPGTNARAWLTTILARRYFDLVKHKRVVDKASIRMAEVPESESHEPSYDGISHEQLADAICQLPAKQRDAIDCCYFQGMRYEEAARHLGVPVGTLGTRLKAGRERLKELLCRFRRK